MQRLLICCAAGLALFSAQPRRRLLLHIITATTITIITITATITITTTITIIPATIITVIAISVGNSSFPRGKAAVNAAAFSFSEMVGTETGFNVGGGHKEGLPFPSGPH